VILCDSFAILPFTLPEEMMTDFGVYLVFERGSCNCAVVVVVGVANIHSFPSNRSRIIIIIVVVCKIYVIFASFIHRYI
jgi:hypothetical protein